jgi:HK97 family phage portal protein
MASWGNGYLYKRYLGKLHPDSLWPLRPDRIAYRELAATDPDGEPLRFYEYTLPDGQIRNIPARDVIHLRGFGFDGREGYNPAIQGREAIGLAAAAERYAAAFYANDATPRTVLKHKKSFKTDEAAGEIRKSWEERMRGLDRAHLVAILEDDMDVETIGVDAEKAQLLGSREFNAEDVARWFRMPPHKIGAMRKATYSNIEHQALEYVVDTLTPWLSRIEQRLTVDLLTEEEQDQYFLEHNVAGLLRGDFETRMKGYRIGREISIYSTNDVLELENRNPIGPEGDIRHIPLNWVELGSSQPPEPPPDPDRDPEEDARTAELLLQLESRRQAGQDRAAQMRIRLRDVYRPLFRQAADQVAAREKADVIRAARRYLKKEDPEGLRAWVHDFYGPKHVDFIRDKLTPVVESYAEALAGVVTDHLGDDQVNADMLDAFRAAYVDGPKGRAGYYAGKGAAAVYAMLDEVGDDLVALEGALADMRAKRPDAWANLETVRAGEALVREAYTHAGVIAFRWRSGRDDCPFAGALNGKTRQLGQPFIRKNETLKADGQTLEPSSDINHAPAHGGCVCYCEPVLQGDQ